MKTLELKILDKNGRRIELGDVLKVFHFTGARRKKYYMHKQVIALEKRASWESPMFLVSHLNLKNETFYMLETTFKSCDIEIVQGYKDGVDFEDREKGGEK